MKTTEKRDNRLWLSLFLLICSVCAMAEPEEFVCKKNYNYSYPVKKNYTLDLNNSFGKTIISHWNKEEVEIKVDVITKARSEKMAQTKLNSIEVKVEQAENTIKGKTKIGSDSKGNNFSGSMEINYYVNVPTWMNLKLYQEFGNIQLPQQDNNGSCKLVVKYGRIDAGDFSQPLSIKADFGDIQIGNAGNATINLRYCGGSSIESANNLTVSDAFSELTIGKANKMELNSSYGNLTIEQANDMEGKIRFGHLKVKNLTNSFICHSQSYSDVILENVNAQFETIRSNASFCKLCIGLPKHVSCKIKAYNLKYGRCDIDEKFKFTKDLKDSDNTDDRTIILNDGEKRMIDFDGGNYGSLRVEATD